MNDKVYQAVKSGTSDNNINFHDFRNLIVDLGFVFRRQSGSHMIYYHPGINERMNIKPEGSKAKPYQVKQLRNLINDYGL